MSEFDRSQVAHPEFKAAFEPGQENERQLSLADVYGHEVLSIAGVEITLEQAKTMAKVMCPSDKKDDFEASEKWLHDRLTEKGVEVDTKLFPKFAQNEAKSSEPDKTEASSAERNTQKKTEKTVEAKPETANLAAPSVEVAESTIEHVDEDQSAPQPDAEVSETIEVTDIQSDMTDVEVQETDETTESSGPSTPEAPPEDEPESIIPELKKPVQLKMQRTTTLPKATVSPKKPLELTVEEPYEIEPTQQEQITELPIVEFSEELSPFEQQVLDEKVSVEDMDLVHDEEEEPFEIAPASKQSDVIVEALATNTSAELNVETEPVVEQFIGDLLLIESQTSPAEADNSLGQPINVMVIERLIALDSNEAVIANELIAEITERIDNFEFTAGSAQQELQHAELEQFVAALFEHLGIESDERAINVFIGQLLKHQMLKPKTIESFLEPDDPGTYERRNYLSRARQNVINIVEESRHAKFGKITLTLATVR